MTRRIGQLPTRATLIRTNGEDRFVVPPSNAVITDGIGLFLAGALFFATDSLLLKILAAGGATWMGVALGSKLIQLAFASSFDFDINIAELSWQPHPDTVPRHRFNF